MRVAGTQSGAVLAQKSTLTVNVGIGERHDVSLCRTTATDSCVVFVCLGRGGALGAQRGTQKSSSSTQVARVNGSALRSDEEAAHSGSSFATPSTNTAQGLLTTKDS